MAEVTPIRYLSPREVGEIYGTSGDTIRRILRKKQMKAVRLYSGLPYYKILPSEVLRYAREHEIPISDSARELLEEYLATEPKGSV